jgi:hypothetical protein
VGAITEKAVVAAAEAIEDYAFRTIGRDLGTIHRDDIVRAGLIAAMPEILLGMARHLERIDSSLCSCYRHSSREINPPTNPHTGALMDHHCECLSTQVAWELIKDTTAHTVHFQQCDHKEEYGT